MFNQRLNIYSVHSCSDSVKQMLARMILQEAQWSVDDAIELYGKGIEYFKEQFPMQYTNFTECLKDLPFDDNCKEASYSEGMYNIVMQRI